MSGGETCAKCGRPLHDRPATGRPPKFCGVGCRRSAELAVRRIDARIGALEEALERLDGGLGGWDGTPPGLIGPLTEAKRAALTKCEARLRDLLEALEPPRRPTAAPLFDEQKEQRND
jgi:hypothetical protein